MSVSGQNNPWPLGQQPESTQAPTWALQRMLPEIARRATEVGGILLAILLPLGFNPLSSTPFEPFKVILLWLITSLMAGITLLSWLVDPQRKPISVQLRALYQRLGPCLSLSLTIAAAGLLLSTAASRNPSMSLRGTAENSLGTATLLVVMLLFLLLANGLRTRAQIDRMVKAIQIGSVPVAIYGLVQAASLDPLTWLTDSVSPVHATMGRSNFLAAYLAVVIPFSLLGLTTNIHGDRRKRYIILLVLQIACLIATLARGGWLGFSTGMVVYLGLLGYHRRSRRLWLAASLSLAASALVFLLINLGNPFSSPAAIAPGSQPAYATLREESVNRRYIIWNETLHLVVERWPLGYGPATFESVFSEHSPPGTLYDGADRVVDDPHNLWLYHLMSSGLLGLLAWIGILASIYVALWRKLLASSEKRDAATVASLLAALTAYLVQAQFNPQVVTLLALLWLILALGVAQASLKASRVYPQPEPGARPGIPSL